MSDWTYHADEWNEAGVQKFYFQIMSTRDKEMIDPLTDALKGMF